MVDDRSCYAKACRLDLFRANFSRSAADFAQKLRDDRIKRGIVGAFVAALRNLFIFLSMDPVQGEIALGAADIRGQDHLLLPGFARTVPAGFPRGGPGECGAGGSSKAAAASSTRNNFTPLSRG